MLCCLKNSREKKNLFKPLLAESKTYGGEPKTEAPKIIERKLTGFEPAPLPAPKPFVTLTPKTEPIVIKSEPEPEPESLPEPEPEPESLPEPLPEPIKQEAEISEPITIPSKNEDNPAPKEKKNRSKSNRH